jgi:hypothetical protein
MVKCCVFFAVRTELLNIIRMSFGFKGLTEPVNAYCYSFSFINFPNYSCFSFLRLTSGFNLIHVLSLFCELIHTYSVSTPLSVSLSSFISSFSFSTSLFCYFLPDDWLINSLFNRTNVKERHSIQCCVISVSCSRNYPFLWNLKFHYPVHKSLLLDPTLSQFVQNICSRCEGGGKNCRPIRKSFIVTTSHTIFLMPRFTLQSPVGTICATCFNSH